MTPEIKKNVLTVVVGILEDVLNGGSIVHNKLLKYIVSKMQLFESGSKFIRTISGWKKAALTRYTEPTKVDHLTYISQAS